MKLDSHINGLLLGDGHLELHPKGKNACLRVNRSIRDEQYLLFTARALSEYSTDKSVIRGFTHDKRTKKDYHWIRFRSKCNPIFTQYYNDWYVDGKKKIPKNLVLDNEMLATWFADDGSIRIEKRIYDVKLATHSFEGFEVEFLQDQLLRLGISSKIYYEEKQGSIRITKKQEVKNFVDAIMSSFSTLNMNRKAVWNETYSFLIPRISIQCKWCKSMDTSKNGSCNGRRKFLCKECGRQFNE